MTPHPARTSQPAWVDTAACDPGGTPEGRGEQRPTTATPRVDPTWREVEAMAEATPACARGIPETAALVMGALTKPKPMPNTT